MADKILEEIIQKHDIAESYISIFFAGVDFMIYLYIIFNFGCDFSAKCSHRHKLSILIILDLLFRISILYSSSFVYSFVNEVIKTLFASIEFYIMLSLINLIFTDKNNESYLESSEIQFPFLSTIVFFILAISLNISKKLSLVQYILAIAAIVIYGFYFSGKFDLFLQNIEKKNSEFSGKICLHNLLLFIPLYLIINYILKIISLLVENKLYCSYMEMACDIFKEVGRYLAFFLVINIFSLFIKYMSGEDYENNYNSNRREVNITSISSS